jgi:aminoglycoside 6'-N-acetyltransferase I
MIRPYRAADVDALARLRHALWPEGSVDEHAQELHAMLAWADYAVLIAERDGELLGFAEVALRLRTLGYFEGWYVRDEHRRQGLGAALLHACEQWARERGCTEMASDTWLDNEVSQRAHEALGFEEVERVVNYRKRL